MSLKMYNFAEATAVNVVDSHTYIVNLQDDWAIGTVPQGGYVTSCFMAVTQKHFSTTLASRKQPHVLALHLEFLRRTSVGPATFKVVDKKLGGATSIVHVSLVQEGDREEVVGYITHCSLDRLAGISLDTRWTLDGPPVPPVDLTRLSIHGEDSNWVRAPDFFAHFRKALKRYDMFVPRAGRQIKSVVDEWLRLASGEPFTDVTLGSVADMFPLMVEGFIDEIRAQKGMKSNQETPAFWYPTLLLNLEIKKKLPEEGVKWLFVRVRAKEIKNGRNDLELVIMDEHGDIIALSHHVAMIVDASRNLAARSNKDQGSSSPSKM